MTGSRGGTVAAPQLKKDFQAADQPRASSASPTGRGMHDARAALRLPRPDLRLVGSEDVHQWLLPGVFAALFLIGILTAARGWQQVELAAHSASWPYTRGLIVSSEVQAYSSSEGARWRPVVTYLYRVGKRQLMGTRVRLVEPVSAFNETEARKYAERYRLHGEVLVYYNPERISESVLDHSAPASAYLTIDLGLALATASAALIIISLRSRSTGRRRLHGSELPQSN